MSGAVPGVSNIPGEPCGDKLILEKACRDLSSGTIGLKQQGHVIIWGRVGSVLKRSGGRRRVSLKCGRK